MGAAARKLAHSAAPARPVLRLVPARSPRARARARAKAGAAVFRISAVCLLILASAGVARVALAAQAAEAAIDAWEVKSELKAERTATRSLEADRSSLVAPSRIEVLACETLNMSSPVEVCYLELSAPVTEAAQPEHDAPTLDQVPQNADTGTDARTGVAGMLATLVDLAAGEAQVLLVGDMGLGTAR